MSKKKKNTCALLFICVIVFKVLQQTERLREQV